MKPILAATSNQHKLDEITTIMAPLGIEIYGLGSLDVRPEEPVEDGDTFAANARLKAIHYALQTALPCLADDSGLEVEALDGAPGVRSARYAGLGNTGAQRDQANNERLLRELDGIPDHQRSARFVCAMCLCDSRGMILAETQGIFAGRIEYAPEGHNGFGYDPLLYLPDLGLTCAQLTPEQKSARSHRGKAAREMATRIRALGL